MGLVARSKTTIEVAAFVAVYAALWAAGVAVMSVALAFMAAGFFAVFVFFARMMGVM